MKIQILFVASLFVLIPTVSQAQAAVPPYTTTNRLTWSAPSNAGTATVAQTLEYHFTVTAGTTGTPTPVSGVIVTGVTCAGTAAPFACSAALASGWLQTLNDLGQRNLTLFAIDTATGGGAGPASVPFVSRVPPTAPTALGLQ